MLRKIASSDTAMVSKPKGKGSNAFAPGIAPESNTMLVAIHTKKIAALMNRKGILPLNPAMKFASR